MICWCILLGISGQCCCVPLSLSYERSHTVNPSHYCDVHFDLWAEPGRCTKNHDLEVKCHHSRYEGCLCFSPAQESGKRTRSQRKAQESLLPRATGFSPFNNIFDYEWEKSMVFLFLPSNRKVCVMVDTFRKYQVCCYTDFKTCSCNIKPGDYARSCLYCLLIHSCAWIDFNLRNYPM